MYINWFYFFLVIGCVAFVVALIYPSTPSYRRKKNPVPEEERSSYVNENTNEIFLRSYDYPQTESEEWVISNNTITINKCNGRDTSKTIFMSQFSGIKIERSKDTFLELNMVYLKLFIGGGASSAVIMGSGGVSGQANYTLALDLSDLKIAQNAHDYIVGRIGQSDQTVELPQERPPTQSVADEIVKLKTLVDQGILTEEEFEHKKRVLLGL